MPGGQLLIFACGLHTQPTRLGESASELAGGSVPSAPGAPSKSVMDGVRGKWNDLTEGTEVTLF